MLKQLLYKASVARQFFTSHVYFRRTKDYYVFISEALAWEYSLLQKMIMVCIFKWPHLNCIKS